MSKKFIKKKFFFNCAFKMNNLWINLIIIIGIFLNNNNKVNGCASPAFIPSRDPCKINKIKYFSFLILILSYFNFKMS
jgi:hypothetical protein